MNYEPFDRKECHDQVIKAHNILLEARVEVINEMSRVLEKRDMNSGYYYNEIEAQLSKAIYAIGQVAFVLNYSPSQVQGGRMSTNTELTNEELNKVLDFYA